MNLDHIWQNITSGFNNPQITTHDIITTLLMVGIFSLFEFVVYRFISKRSFYSKEFNITLAILPFFISTIIMALQSNLVITLGTIGALAIIRFRTAVKDPIDMIYLLWAVHTGIICGTGLYEICFLTSICVAILMFILDLIPVLKPSYLLVVNVENTEAEPAVLKAVRELSSTHTVKSRNLMKDKLDMVIEVRTKDENHLIHTVSEIDGVKNLSLVSHDGENFL